MSSTVEQPLAGEDHSEILAQIDAIAAANKIQVTPQLFKTKPEKSGFILPVLVNLGSVILVVAGIIGASYFFTRQYEELVEKTAPLQSTEGRLLQQIKKDAEANMAEKEKQIKEINSQLSKVQVERDGLATDMEGKLKDRENQIRAQLASVLESERQKLRQQGYSEAEIERRVKIIEQQKTAEFNNQLTQYKNQLAAEKAKAEAELQKLANQYGSQLDQAKNDREQVAAESKRKEEELRKQLSAQQAAAANTSTDAQAKIQQANEQIAKLNQLKEQERNLGAQVLSYYATIRENLQAKNWTEALRQIDLFRKFLNSSAVGNTESAQAQKDAQLFIADSLATLIEREKTQVDTGDLVKNAARVKEAEALLGQAQVAVKLGDTDTATASFEQLLRQIPGGSEAMNWFVNQEKAKQTTVSLDTKQQKELETKLSDALKESETLKKKAADQDKLIKKLETDAKSLGADTKADLKKAQDDLAAASKQVASLQTQLDEERKKPKAAATSTSQPPTATSNQVASAESKERIAALEKDLATAKQSQTDLTALVTAYQSYASKLSKNTNNAKLELDSFLASQQMQKLMPILADQIRQYDKAIASSGSQTALIQLNDRLYTIGSLPAAQRRAAVQTELSKTQDATLKEFYTTMLKFLP